METVKKIDIIITMGGLGSRFRKAGYSIPKYMIEAKGKTLFEWSMLSLTSYQEITDQYIFIVINDKTVDVQKFIEEQCKTLNIQQYKIIVIDELTDGQASTAMLAAEHWNKDNGLLIYNIDTYVEAGEMKAEDIKGEGFIPCFQAAGNHWSFVRLDEKEEVVEIKEKERISDYCTIGAYYFQSCALYEKLYNTYYSDKTNLVKGEKYVAPLYNQLLKDGGKIYITNIPTKKVHVLGTPEELEQFISGK